MTKQQKIKTEHRNWLETLTREGPGEHRNCLQPARIHEKKACSESVEWTPELDRDVNKRGFKQPRKLLAASKKS